MSQSMIVLVDFVRGEVRELTEWEHQAMVAEQMKRTKVKDGIIYFDCEPPK
jgi:hypothetical protein